jgi:methionyl-tRNA synthetase
MEYFRIDQATEHAVNVIRFLNKYIDTRAPWALAKNNDPELASVLRSMLLCLRTAEGLIRPIMPKTADAIAAQLGVGPIGSWEEIGTDASLPAGTAIQQPKPIFPRLDLKKPEKTEKPEKSEKKEKPVEQPTPQEPISIEDFLKVQLRVARIVEAEPVEKSDKLMKLQVTIGEEKRQIVAGIRKDYEPIDLIGRQIVVVYNLKPAMLRGVESQGMLLAATSEDGGAILLQPDREAPEGTKVK